MSQYHCYYCHLRDRRVEAGGVHSCPNVLCTGPGASWFRRRQASYEECGDGSHTVDDAEMVSAARAYVDALPYKDRALAEHILSCISKWESQASEATDAA